MAEFPHRDGTDIGYAEGLERAKAQLGMQPVIVFPHRDGTDIGYVEGLEIAKAQLGMRPAIVFPHRDGTDIGYVEGLERAKAQLGMRPAIVFPHKDGADILLKDALGVVQKETTVKRIRAGNKILNLRIYDLYALKNICNTQYRVYINLKEDDEDATEIEKLGNLYYFILVSHTDPKASPKRVRLKGKTYAVAYKQ